MSSAEQPKYVSPEDYLAAEDAATTKSEYIDGWVRAMSGGTVRHNLVKMNCTLALGQSLRGKRCRPFDSDMKLSIRHRDSIRYYYPDLQVICDSTEPTDVYQDRPVVIVEVLSPSTRTVDLDEKLNAYLQIPSLECYVILEQHIAYAIVMRRTVGGFLRETYEGLDEIIPLPAIDCMLPMRDVYEGVELEPAPVIDPGHEA